ncbi:hypothetical protein [Amycolatopsis azurea]|uniref:Holin n=1 Tax=Amycolatopsis azurea DSM 43854 TaxID=1238180 RepID=M2PY05_9PSEU|nr:hypothetical protein [Amycolatopsis azurea]EMD24555.1 hypothetical protein C791_5575 [Amycolatopsis azurea DSM 43854]OOC02038.1 hypothetical protein B0293_34190 [Amycolatopsis azurea DSM 43854]
MSKNYGFLTVVAGLSALAVIAVTAVWRYPNTSDVTAVITAAGTVIGTVVGAFFGVNAASAGRVKAEESRDQATAALVKVATKADEDSEVAKAAMEGVR